jgi:hypothetical protein
VEALGLRRLEPAHGPHRLHRLPEDRDLEHVQLPEHHGSLGGPEAVVRNGPHPC